MLGSPNQCELLAFPDFDFHISLRQRSPKTWGWGCICHKVIEAIETADVLKSPLLELAVVGDQDNLLCTLDHDSLYPG